MGNRREFDIAFVGLKPGLHEFNYEVDDKFFANYKETDFSNCHATIKLTLEKNTSFMMLNFEIGGSVNVICDRCGNTLPMDLWDEFKLVVKQVDNPEEMNQTEEDADVFYISRTESHLHLADWIYEFVLLSIPNQRMCKEEEMGGLQCNKEVLAMLKKMQSAAVENNHPLQKGLEKFKKNIN
ncbi:MAG: YceD family protein [Ginsengibacter sp.]